MKCFAVCGANRNDVFGSLKKNDVFGPINFPNLDGKSPSFLSLPERNGPKFCLFNGPKKKRKPSASPPSAPTGPLEAPAALRTEPNASAHAALQRACFAAVDTGQRRSGAAKLPKNLLATLSRSLRSPPSPQEKPREAWGKNRAQALLQRWLSPGSCGSSLRDPRRPRGPRTSSKVTLRRPPLPVFGSHGCR